MFAIRERSCFQAFLSYWRPNFGLLDDSLKVAYGNNASFAEYQTTFWLALPSWFRKLSNIRIERKQTTKQYSNSHPIMKICYQIILEFEWYASFALTVILPQTNFETNLIIALNNFCTNNISHHPKGIVTSLLCNRLQS